MQNPVNVLINSVGGSSSKPSTMRIVTYITAISILGNYLAWNIYSMVHGKTVVDFPYVSAGLLAAVLGLKMYQTKFENTPPDTTTDSPEGQK